MTTHERHFEEELIAKLGELKYAYREGIRDRATLEKNFREKFESLNHVHLTDGEFQRLLDDIVTPDVFTAAHTLRNRSSFTRDDGTPLNYTLVNIADWCKNSFEVVNQLRINTNYSHHRYDVILLINGVPVVQIELKTLGINPRRAIEQIVDYKNDPGNGYTRTLLCFVQLFIVTNRDSTYYFANNNARHFAFNADEHFLPIYEHARPDNSKVKGLDAFAEAFLPKCTLGQMISRHMVLVASEQKLMMMRPYQIYAVKNIVECIEKNLGNGYVWHTTGSGKTLTSFKASTLLKANPTVDKCLFVVDRKDLGLRDFSMEVKIGKLLERYADFNFKIEYDRRKPPVAPEKTERALPPAVVFFRERDKDGAPIPIKVSRGEESLFIWCFFLAIVELAMNGEQAYEWVKHLYIDDPISSLDEQNAVAIAAHLASMLKDANAIKTVASTHHPLFFNVLYNELHRTKGNRFFFLGRSSSSGAYSLTDTSDTPFFHHVACLMELHDAARSGHIFTHHFNMLRVIVGKTASFLGYDKFVDCIKKDEGDQDGILHNRLLNLLSHGKYSLYEPKEMLDENKRHFKKMLSVFTERFVFNPTRFPRLEFDEQSPEAETPQSESDPNLAKNTP